MEGTLEIRDLRVVCIIGVLPQERSEPQEILIDLVATVEIGDAVSSDSIQQAEDYTQIADTAVQTCQSGQFQLMETLVHRVASHLLDRFRRIKTIQVRARKPSAIPSASFAAVSIRLSR